MEYFEGSRPIGSARCSDKEGPCPSPGTEIPAGEGYLYISEQVVEFRRDARTEAEMRAKAARVYQQKLGGLSGGVVFLGAGVAEPILMCEQCATARDIDLDTAAEDAKHWWETEKIPLRPTPKKKVKLMECPECSEVWVPNKSETCDACGFQGVVICQWCDREGPYSDFADSKCPGCKNGTLTSPLFGAMALTAVSVPLVAILLLAFTLSSDSPEWVKTPIAKGLALAFMIVWTSIPVSIWFYIDRREKRIRKGKFVFLGPFVPKK